VPGPPPQVRGELRAAAGALQDKQGDQRGRGQLPDQQLVLPGAGKVIEQELEPGQPARRGLPAAGAEVDHVQQLHGAGPPARALVDNQRDDRRQPPGPGVLTLVLVPDPGDVPQHPDRHQRVVAALVLESVAPFWKAIDPAALGTKTTWRWPGCSRDLEVDSGRLSGKPEQAARTSSPPARIPTVSASPTRS
jgi:hypothetical protein